MQQYKIPLILIALGGGLLAYKGMNFSSFHDTQYPRDMAEVKKIGFFRLGPEQQMYVRQRYIQDIQTLLEQANRQIQLAQLANDLPACYLYRTQIQRLQASLQRVSDIHCDPTAEDQNLMMVRVALK